jgi:hypothetical protein
MPKKTKAFLKEENLLTLLSQNNFIIPEIQREYVWGNNEDVIKKFLISLKSKIGEACNVCHLPNETQKINIGFLYSYKPDYVKVQNDRFLDENLIDGQQRFTTLFLMLFYFALKEDRKNEFLNLIRFEDDSMCFDFKVRDITKLFFLEFIQKTNSISEFKQISQQTWFLDDYKNDLSVSSVVKALNYITEIFNDSTKYYFHFINKIVFWHFKTEATSEGEELYITMNARGEDLAANEITKAALMLEDKDLLDSGNKWESWQQIFWKNRDQNRIIQSADFGFNSFIDCIAGLENYILTKDDKEFTFGKVNEILSLKKVESYINSFQYLLSKKGVLKSHHKHTKWIDTFYKDIWKIFNDNATNWHVNYGDKNRSTEQNKMVYIWSWLLYINKQQKLGNVIEDLELIRFVRFFFIRKNNNNRSVPSLQKTVDFIIENKVFGLNINEEESEINQEEFRKSNEKIKYNYLSKVEAANFNDLIEIESLIWKIEDHPLNLDGKDLKNINSSHLIDFEGNPSKETITLISSKFYELFPILYEDNINFKNTSKLRNILFFYGKYWVENWASYYWRYDFGDWKKIIRSNNIEGGVFKAFFKDYLKNDLEKLYSETVVLNNEVDFETYDKLEIFKWYAAKLNEELWSQGKFIAFNHFKHEGQDKYFKNIRELVNIKATFNGGDPKVLSELIKN